MELYIYLSTIMFWIFGITWHKRGLVNLVVKIVMIGMALYGSFQSLQIGGYIIKAS